MIFAVLVSFALLFRAQSLQETEGGIYVAEGTTLSVDAGVEITIVRQHIPAPKKNQRHSRSGHVAVTKKASEKSSSQKQYEPSEAIIHFSPPLQLFSSGKAISCCAVISGSGNDPVYAKGYLQPKNTTKFSASSFIKHSSLYKESHRRYEILTPYSCRPPPFPLIIPV